MTNDNDEQDELNPDSIRGWFDTYVKHGCICQYCGFDGTRSPEDWVQLQGDHLIPRGIALEHADDDLNRVVACYYCNTQKRNYDPAGGKFKKIDSLESQKELIENARQYIQDKNSRNWKYGGGLEGSFNYMIRKIRH